MYITSLLLSASLFLSIACSVDSGLNIQPEVKKENPTPSPVPQTNKVKTFTTTSDGFMQLAQKEISLKAGESLAPSGCSEAGLPFSASGCMRKYFLSKSAVSE